jgi:hypothetical protein
MTRLFANPVAIYLALAGAMLLSGGIVLLAARVRLAVGARARGRIVGYVERMQQRRGLKKQFMPVVRFQPHAGPEIEFRSRMGSASKGLPIGETVSVAYRSDRPEAAEIATAARLWLAPIVMIGMALVALYGAWKAGAPS